MKSDAHQFLENLSGGLKTFSTSHGNGPRQGLWFSKGSQCRS
jgi:hypothetical protein